MTVGSDLEIDGRRKSCIGLIAELEKAMCESNISRITVIVQDVPTKIDIYAWAKRKGHRIDAETPYDGIFKMGIVK
ncbi:sulfurtransferase TusA family protein [Candidatus Marsarchaeota archaeon]|nr:sulfurtransferase TusA family protein [Candidatus Marsarchaeota archaeon]